MTIVSSLVDSATSLAQPVIQDYYNQKAEERQEQVNIRAEEREQGYIISSENRANAEYDRRSADQRLYDSPEAVASRYAMAGINPVSAFSGGVVGQTSGISPSGGKAPSAKPVTAQNLHYQPTNLLDNMEKVSAIRNTDAQTKLIEEQTESEYQKGMSQFIDNCWQRFISGDRGNPVNIEQSFKYRYQATVGEDGDLQITNYEGKDISFSLTLEKYVYDSEQYGNFSIYESGYKATREREEIANIIGTNEKIAEDLAQSIVNLYLHAWQVASQGKQADAAMLQAEASKMAADFNFGDEYNAKWWLKAVLESLNCGANVFEAVTSIAKFLPKGALKTLQGVGNKAASVATK